MSRERAPSSGARPERKTLWRTLTGGLAAVLCAGAFLFQGGARPLPPYDESPDDPAEITSLKSEFARTQLGRDQLDFARKNGIGIIYDKTLDARGRAGELSVEDHGSVVGLDPGLETEAKMLILAHELRHGWQQAVLDYHNTRNVKTTPLQYWTISQYIEADACAYSAHFMADRVVRLGVRLPEDRTEYAIARTLAREMKSWNGLTPQEYRKIALEPCFATLTAHNYSERHLALAVEHALRYSKDVLDAVTGARAPESIPGMDAAAFESYLRRFGGVSLDPAAPTSLQAGAVSAQKVTQGYPFFDTDAARKSDFAAAFETKMAKAEESHALASEVAAKSAAGASLAPAR